MSTPKKIRLVVSDIDETFVATDKSFIPKNLDAIKALKRAGILFAFATGRYWPSLKPVVCDLDLHAPQIIDNGAVVIAPDTERILDKTPIATDCAAHFFSEFLKTDFVPILCNGLAYNAPYLTQEVLPDLASHNEIADIVPQETLLANIGNYDKLTVFGCKRYEQVMREVNRISASADEKHFKYTGVYTERGIFVLSAEGVTKGSGLRQLCKILGLGLDEVVAIGDGDNDAPMLAAAGRSFAVANATDLARKSATDLVASNNDAGFAEAVEKILENN